MSEAMTAQYGASFNHEAVVLDGEDFTSCEFRDCRLVYRGGKPPSFTDCKFEGCEWKLEGAAAHTLAHLKAMWSAGAKGPVQDLIKGVTGAGR